MTLLNAGVCLKPKRGKVRSEYRPRRCSTANWLKTRNRIRHRLMLDSGSVSRRDSGSVRSTRRKGRSRSASPRRQNRVRWWRWSEHPTRHSSHRVERGWSPQCCRVERGWSPLWITQCCCCRVGGIGWWSLAWSRCGPCGPLALSLCGVPGPLVRTPPFRALVRAAGRHHCEWDAGKIY